MTGADPPVLVETYQGADPDATAREFAADAADMLEEGDVEGVANMMRTTREWRRP